MKTKVPILTICILSVSNIFAQGNYRYSNIFREKEFENIGLKNDDGTFTVKKISKSLKGYVTRLSDDKDTLFLKFWNIDSVSDEKKDDNTYVNHKNNGKEFAFLWPKNTDANGTVDEPYLDIPFHGITVNATTIPFRYRLKPEADLEAEFLNIGLSVFAMYGTTRYYKQEQIDDRSRYFGIGPFLGFSQIKIDSSNTAGHVMVERQVASINYGLNAVFSWNDISVIVAIGYDNSIGSNAKFWEENNFKNGLLRPWIGFGFGFKLTDIGVKTQNENTK